MTVRCSECFHRWKLDGDKRCPECMGGNFAPVVEVHQTEAAFLTAVVELAKWAKWRVHHQRPAMTKRGWRSAIQGDSGWPDLFMVRGKEVIAAELKSEKGLLSGYQERWLSDLQGAGIEIHVWRPKDMDAIKARLLGESQLRRVLG